MLLSKSVGDDDGVETEKFTMISAPCSSSKQEEKEDGACREKQTGRSEFWLVSSTLPLWLIYISNQWSRSSIYYLVDFSEGANPFNAMNLDIGFSEAQYGFLASVAFTSLFAFASLGAGVASDRLDRKKLSIAAAVIWSTATLATSFSNTYEHVVACRLVMGLACAFTTPAAYPLLIERVPSERLGLANSLYSTGVAVASALSSLSIILDAKLGWRNAYTLVAVYGLLTVAFAALILQDDPRELDKGDEGQTNKAGKLRNVWFDVRDVFATRRVQWIFIGTLFRFSAGLIIGVWSGTYFRMAFVEKQAEFAVAQAAISAVGASLSGVVGGATADWLVASASESTKEFDPVGRRLWVVVVGSILGAPTWYMAVKDGQDFHTAMIWLAAEYGLAECWFGPTISALQSTIAPKVGGTAQGLFSLTGAIANFAPSILGMLYSLELDGKDMQGTLLSTYISTSVSACYLICALCFAIAAKLRPYSAKNDKYR